MRSWLSIQRKARNVIVGFSIDDYVPSPWSFYSVFQFTKYGQIIFEQTTFQGFAHARNRFFFYKSVNRNWEPSKHIRSWFLTKRCKGDNCVSTSVTRSYRSNFILLTIVKSCLPLTCCGILLRFRVMIGISFREFMLYYCMDW